jgi:hypothetical protein
VVERSRGRLAGSAGSAGVQVVALDSPDKRPTPPCSQTVPGLSPQSGLRIMISGHLEAGGTWAFAAVRCGGGWVRVAGALLRQACSGAEAAAVLTD